MKAAPLLLTCLIGLALPSAGLAQPTVQFSASTYTVIESAGAVIITVQRTGDTNAAMAFVFIDNHPKGIAGGSFAVNQPGTWVWGDFPDARHKNGANLSFADGHVEHWRWKEATTIEWAKHASFTNLTVPKGDRDLSRLQECIPHARP